MANGHALEKVCNLYIEAHPAINDFLTFLAAQPFRTLRSLVAWIRHRPAQISSAVIQQRVPDPGHGEPISHVRTEHTTGD